MRDLAGEALAILPGRQPPARASRSPFLRGVLLGLLTGGLVGLLLVPRSGRETRAELRATAGVLLEPLQDAVRQARAEAQRAAAEAEQQVLRRYEAIKAESTATDA